MVFQHPFYWYSMPALLKQWLDLVLELGWAFGGGGAALKDKRMLVATTAGGAQDAYQPDGYNRFTMRQLLAPMEQTAFLCKMVYLPPFTVHGTVQMNPDQGQAHADSYKRLIQALVDDEIDLESNPDIVDMPTINGFVETLPSTPSGGRHAR